MVIRHVVLMIRMVLSVVVAIIVSGDTHDGDCRAYYYFTRFIDELYRCDGNRS